MNYAEEIKARVKMPELLRAYGFQVDRFNRVRCPFHNGKDYNCGVKDGYIHCFVCGESADQIKFVQKLFGLSFQDAISKINEDFSLGLPIGKKLTAREQIELQKRAFQRKMENEAQERKRAEINRKYWSAFDRWAQLDKQKRENSPKSPSEPLNDLYVEALLKIDIAEYELICAEREKNHDE